MEPRPLESVSLHEFRDDLTSAKSTTLILLMPYFDENNDKPLSSFMPSEDGYVKSLFEYLISSSHYLNYNTIEFVDLILTKLIDLRIKSFIDLKGTARKAVLDLNGVIKLTPMEELIHDVVPNMKFINT
jgi:hypothetical protein